METVQPKRLNLKSLDKLAKRGDNLLLLVEDEEDAKAIQNCKSLVDAVFVFRLDPESGPILENFLSCAGDRKIDNFTFIFTVEGKLKSAVVISEDQHDKKIGIVPIPIIDLKPLNADNTNDSSRKISKVARERVGKVLTFLSGQGDGLSTSMTIITPNQPLSLGINPSSRDSMFPVNICSHWEGNWILTNTQTRYKIMGLLDPLCPPCSENTILASKLKLAATGIISLGLIQQVRLIEHYTTNVSEGKYIKGVDPPEYLPVNGEGNTEMFLPESGDITSSRDIINYEYDSRNMFNSLFDSELFSQKSLDHLDSTLSSFFHEKGCGNKCDKDTNTESGSESATGPSSNNKKYNVKLAQRVRKYMIESLGRMFNNWNNAGIEMDMNTSDSEIYSIRNMIGSFKLLQEDPELLKNEAIVLSYIRKVYEDSVENGTPYYLPDGSKVLTNSVTTIDDIARKSLNSEEPTANKPTDGSKVLTNSVTTIDDIVRKSLNSEKPTDCITS